MKNLIIRSLSGIVFLAIMLGCILGGEISYACLMLFILTVMLWEFYQMTLGSKNYLPKAIGIAGGITLWSISFAFLYPSLIYIQLGFILILLLLILWVILFIQQLYQKTGDIPFVVIADSFLGILYIALPLSLLNFIAFDFFGSSIYNEYLLLGLFIILWSSDVGAYCFGMLLGQSGKHKLFPSISPKKSWEGYFGGLLMALAAGYVLSAVGFIPFGTIHTLIIAALIHVFGVFGDLIESMLKRSVDVKDSGKIMPGHGGLLDRFDAALLAFPVVFIYLLVINIF